MKNAIPFFCVASLVAFPSAAQERKGDARMPDERQANEQTPRSYERIETLIGAEVHLMAGPGEPGNEDIGADATGEIEDLIVLPDGRIDWAVVKNDGRQVLVPAKKLRWNDAEDLFQASVSTAELQGKPEFDLAAAKRSGICDAIESVETAWGMSTRKEAREASTRKGMQRFHETKLQVAHHAVTCGSEIDELELFGMAEEFGGVTKTFVDPHNMRVDLVVVSRGGLGGIGGTDYLMPYAALTLCHEPLEEGADYQDAEQMLCVAKTVKELESAPEYDEPDGDTLVSPANRAAAMRFFGKGMGKDDKGGDTGRKKPGERQGG